MSGYGLAADLMLGLHALIIAYAASLPLLVLWGGWRRWRWVRKPWPRMLHLGLICFVATQALLGELCPLTEWESALRVAAGGSAYGEQGLIADLLHASLFFALPKEVFALIYCAFAGLVVATFYWVPVRLKAKPHAAEP